MVKQKPTHRWHSISFISSALGMASPEDEQDEAAPPPSTGRRIRLPLKLETALLDTSDLLDGWDPMTQVGM